ncbi:hypothetical protein CEUSTIGMA_g8881.t1 [Chlamydomonas eustigma]|uniref:Protein kinase domain-containing protein n=1 Tax=Chlamydomonas eustigma TaxID=1157962 RepID=A0A250XEV7_9CHLO|nr:hypothetical protein CEUSTIGMA_g8881.t1 [Chlamydomonas eustigma]|eukprot:GAX81452.1 hypothetical protein CEUSTIGMA_g8881.t1 [Chlamydomonas eustigma]
MNHDDARGARGEVQEALQLTQDAVKALHLSVTQDPLPSHRDIARDVVDAAVLALGRMHDAAILRILEPRAIVLSAFTLRQTARQAQAYVDRIKDAVAERVGRNKDRSKWQPSPVSYSNRDEPVSDPASAAATHLAFCGCFGSASASRKELVTKTQQISPAAATSHSSLVKSDSVHLLGQSSRDWEVLLSQCKEQCERLLNAELLEQCSAAAGHHNHLQPSPSWGLLSTFQHSYSNLPSCPPSGYVSPSPPTTSSALTSPQVTVISGRGIEAIRQAIRAESSTPESSTAVMDSISAGHKDGTMIAASGSWTQGRPITPESVINTSLNARPKSGGGLASGVNSSSNMSTNMSAAGMWVNEAAGYQQYGYGATTVMEEDQAGALSSLTHPVLEPSYSIGSSLGGLSSVAEAASTGASGGSYLHTFPHQTGGMTAQPAPFYSMTQFSVQGAADARDGAGQPGAVHMVTYSATAATAVAATSVQSGSRPPQHIPSLPPVMEGLDENPHTRARPTPRETTSPPSTHQHCFPPSGAEVLHQLPPLSSLEGQYSLMNSSASRLATNDVSHQQSALESSSSAVGRLNGAVGIATKSRGGGSGLVARSTSYVPPSPEDVERALHLQQQQDRRLHHIWATATSTSNLIGHHAESTTVPEDYYMNYRSSTRLSQQQFPQKLVTTNIIPFKVGQLRKSSRKEAGPMVILCLKTSCLPPPAAPHSALPSSAKHDASSTAGRSSHVSSRQHSSELAHNPSVASSQLSSSFKSTLESSEIQPAGVMEHGYGHFPWKKSNTAHGISGAGMMDVLPASVLGSGRSSHHHQHQEATSGVAASMQLLAVTGQRTLVVYDSSRPTEPDSIGSDGVIRYPPPAAGSAVDNHGITTIAAAAAGTRTAYPPQIISCTVHHATSMLWMGHTDGSISVHFPGLDNTSGSSNVMIPEHLHPSGKLDFKTLRLPNDDAKDKPGRVAAMAAATEKHNSDMTPLISPAAVYQPAPVTALCCTEDDVHNDKAAVVIWAGDASGRFLAVKYDSASHSVQLVHPLTALTYPSASSRRKQDLPRNPHHDSSTSATLVDAGGTGGTSSGTTTVGTVTSILSKGGLVVATSLSGLLHLIRAADVGRAAVVQLGATNFGARYGPCYCMATLPWRPDNPRPHTPETLAWRLLTGHGSGQCLVWDLSNARAAAVCTLGMVGGPPVRGICVSCELHCMVLGLEDGQLSVCPLPSASMAGGLMEEVPSGKVPVWVLQQELTRAHNSRMTAFTSMRYGASSYQLATGSAAGGIKIWDVAVLRKQASVKGMDFPPAYSPSTEPYYTQNIYQVHLQRDKGLVGPDFQGPGLTAAAVIMIGKTSTPQVRDQAEEVHDDGGVHAHGGRDTLFLESHQTYESAPAAALQGMPTSIHMEAIPFAALQKHPLPGQGSNGSVERTSSASIRPLSKGDSFPGFTASGAIEAISVGGSEGGGGVDSNAATTGRTEIHFASEGGASAATASSSFASGNKHYLRSPDRGTSSSKAVQTQLLLHSGSDPAQVVSDWMASQSYHNVIKREELRIIEEIGRGAEGSVFLGRWHHISVAVKEMHPQRSPFTRLQDIAKDISEEGLCLDPPRIVTEYYPLGSLFAIISKAREGDQRVIHQLSWARRLQMLHNIAAGMAYLHSRSYVHGDLRSPNIFVGLDGHVKIGDFGFARLLGEGRECTDVSNRTTNPRWLAPEVLIAGISSRASDVFSFSIIMWEMLTLQIPYTGYFSLQVTYHHTLDSFRPDIPPDSELPVSLKVNLDPFKALMCECWHQDPDMRPSFSEVAARLSALMHWQNTVGRIRAQMHAATKAMKQQQQQAAAPHNSATAGETATPSRSSSVNGGGGAHILSSASMYNGQASSSATVGQSSAMMWAHQQQQQKGGDPQSSSLLRDHLMPRAGVDDSSKTTGHHITHLMMMNSSLSVKTEESFEDGMQFEAMQSSPHDLNPVATAKHHFDEISKIEESQETAAAWSVSAAEPCSPFGSAVGFAAAAASEDCDQFSAPSSLVGGLYPSSTVSSSAFMTSGAGAMGYGALAGGRQQQGLLEEELPSMPLPGLPNTALTTAAAAWLNSVVTANKSKTRQQGPSVSSGSQLQPHTSADHAAVCAPAAASGETHLQQWSRRRLDLDIADKVQDASFPVLPVVAKAAEGLSLLPPATAKDEASRAVLAAVPQWDADVQMYKHAWGA